MIKCIDIFGQFNSKGTAHYYIYPQVLSPESRQLFRDPRADLGAFQIDVNVTDLFALFCTKEGWWISIVKRHEHDSRQGYAMFSVCLGANRPMNGQEAVQLLREGYKQFVDDRIWDNEQTETWDNEQTETWLQTHTLQLTQCDITPFTMPTSLADNNNSAYRTFATEADLQQALTYISQKEYSKFSRVFLIPNTAAPVNTGHRMQQVTSPINRAFTIQHTPDTDPSVPRVAIEGETVKIVYLRNDLKSEPISYKVGSLHKAVDVDSINGVVVLKDPKTAGAIFYKKILLRTHVTKEIKLSRELQDKGIKYNPQTKTLLVPDDLDLNFEGSLICEGYQPYPVKSSDLCKGKDISVNFEEKPVPISVFIDGRSYKVVADISLSKAKDWEKKGLGNLSRNSFVIHTKKEEEESVVSMILKVLGAVFAVLIGGYALYASACGIMGWNVWPFQHEESTCTESTADSTVVTPVAPFTELPSDSTYFKEQDTWEEKELKSEEGKNLLSALKNGHINEILREQDACFLGVKNVNGHWTKIIETLSNIDPSKRTKAEAEIKRLSSTGKINLSELQTALKKIETDSSRPESQSVSANQTSTPSHSATTPAKKKPKNPDAAKIGKSKPAAEKVSME